MTAPRTFPSFRFTGSHRSIGRQYGEACRDLIHRHLVEVRERIESRTDLTFGAAVEAASGYRGYVLAYAPFLDDEIQGVAEGAGLDLAEAYLLQLRAEAAATPTRAPAPLLAGPDEEPGECTTYAIGGDATIDGVALVGSNSDLPGFYAEIEVVVELVPDDAPAVLMVTPAGQVSYVGINDRGLGVFANFLTCDGWRLGFPRYLLSRLALTRDTVDDAIAVIRSTPRASSRNFMLLDGNGIAADLETTPVADGRLDPENGVLVHANHFLSSGLRHEERAPDGYLPNSRIRQERLQQLIDAGLGMLNVDRMAEILRDRATFPDALCRMPGDLEVYDQITTASMIAAPSRGEMWVAVGPPTLHPYRRHAFGGQSGPTLPHPLSV